MFGPIFINYHQYTSEMVLVAENETSCTVTGNHAEAKACCHVIGVTLQGLGILSHGAVHLQTNKGEITRYLLQLHDV